MGEVCLFSGRVQIPTSRKGREKWGTRQSHPFAKCAKGWGTLTSSLTSAWAPNRKGMNYETRSN
jgi:hypothetical protein